MTKEAAVSADGAMTIDMHAHWLPKPLADGLRRRTEPPMIGRGEDGREWLDVGFQRTALEEGFDDVAVRLGDMDKHGVARGVLSLSTFSGIECLPLDAALPLCRAFNDAVSAAAVAHPDRFSGLAALPVADAAATLAEFERAMALPGMVGALLPGDGFLSARRAERFKPIFAAANERGAILLVHYGHL